jgi:hemerythrin
VRAVLARLCAYVEVHFAYEEQVMRENGFPELPQHRLLHDKLRQQTLNLVEEMDHLTSHSMLQFLKEWFVEHILNQDKKLARHLARVAQSLPA